MRKARAAEAAAPRPFRIGVIDRLRLRAQGRSDGRRAIPDVTTALPPVTTATREALLAEFLDAVHGMRVRYLETSELQRRELVSLRHRIPKLRAAVERAEQALREAEAERPDPANPERRPGDRDASPELVLERRRREHRRRLDRARTALGQAQAALEHDELAAQVLETELDGGHDLAASRAQRSRATFKRKRAIYDRALLHRHPDRRVMDGLLDDGLPPFPSWVENGREES